MYLELMQKVLKMAGVERASGLLERLSKKRADEGYDDNEEAQRWPVLAKSHIGCLSEGEYCSFDPEDDAESQQALDDLAAEGYVVCREVAREQDLKTAEDLLWDFMEGCGAGIRRDDPTTWALPAYSRRQAKEIENEDAPSRFWPAEDGTGIISCNAIALVPENTAGELFFRSPPNKKKHGAQKR